MSIKARVKGKSSKRIGGKVSKVRIKSPKAIRGNVLKGSWVKDQNDTATNKFLKYIEKGIADKNANKTTVKLIVSGEDKVPNSNEDKVPNSIGEYIKQKSAINPDFKRKVDEHNTRLAAAIAVQNLRESLDLTQREFAELVHKPQSTIARIELGSTNVKMSTLREIGEQTNKKLVIKFV